MQDPPLSGTAVGLLTGTPPAHLQLTRESSADDNVVILWVAIKNEVLIGSILEGKSHLCPWKTGRNYRLWLEGTAPHSFKRELNGAEVCFLLAQSPLLSLNGCHSPTVPQTRFTL